MKKIVVTGATSMIGTALIEVAVRERTEIYAIVRPETNRMDRLVSSPLVHIVYGRLENLMQIEGIPTDCEVLYHFAWAGTSKQMRDEPEIQELNVRYTMDAVKLAKKTGCKRFVGAGSQAEYGFVDGIIDENTKYAPITSYGIAKYTANILSKKLCERLGIEHVWGRIFSIYGPHDNEGTMINYVLDCWKKGETAFLSDGSKYWNYLFETDAGEMFYRLADSCIPCGVYFIANSDSKRLSEYLEEMKLVYDSNVKIEFQNVQSNNGISLNVDMKKTLSILKIKPKVQFMEGIRIIKSLK